jgi:predicted oxidoreductase
MDSPLVTNQIELSLTASWALTNGDLAFLQEKGIRPMAWSPLGGGEIFTSKNSDLHAELQKLGEAHGADAAAAALAWVLAHPARVLPVVGTNRLDRIARLNEATRIPIDRETWFALYTLALGREVP